MKREREREIRKMKQGRDRVIERERVMIGHLEIQKDRERGSDAWGALDSVRPGNARKKNT